MQWLWPSSRDQVERRFAEHPLMAPPRFVPYTNTPTNRRDIAGTLFASRGR